MAQFSTDFADSGYDAGYAAPDWTLEWESAESDPVFEFLVESDATNNSHGDQVMDVTELQVGTEYGALSWDDVGTPTDVDVKAKVLPNGLTDSRHAGIVVRGDMDSVLRIGYFVTLDKNGQEVELFRTSGSTHTALGTARLTYDMGNTANKFWRWIRFQISGSDLKVKTWKDGQDEPAGWGIEVSDGTYSGAGFVGLFTNNGEFQCDWFGVGTDVDAPPAEPSAVGDAVVSQVVVEVLRAVGASAETQPVVAVMS